LRNYQEKNAVSCMKLPEFDDFEFSPMAWKEWLLDKEKFGSKRRIFRHLKVWNKQGYFEGCSRIKNYVGNKRIRRLLNGYAILDLLDWTKTLEYTRFKMWRLFEDTVAEILKEAIRDKEGCTIAYVDRWPGFQGLDYLIINSKSRLGWKVGIQCKRYVGTRIPYRRVNEYSSYTRGVSASKLYDRGLSLKERYPDGRKLVLATFNAYRRNKLQEKRFNWLSEAWDCVIVFDKNTSDDLPYTYRLRFDELNKIVRWC